MGKIISVWVFSLVKKIEWPIYLMFHVFLQVRSMVSVHSYCKSYRVREKYGVTCFLLDNLN